MVDTIKNRSHDNIAGLGNPPTHFGEHKTGQNGMSVLTHEVDKIRSEANDLPENFLQEGDWRVEMQVKTSRGVVHTSYIYLNDGVIYDLNGRFKSKDEGKLIPFKKYSSQEKEEFTKNFTLEDIWDSFEDDTHMLISEDLEKGVEVALEVQVTMIQKMKEGTAIGKPYETER